ncbi:hypothetical protein EDD15DRAFT_2203864 [Pisolithus albus]|nr:hypothetical protein EDD15DRAFT_2203864 [Pisolithus albus]
MVNNCKQVEDIWCDCHPNQPESARFKLRVPTPSVGVNGGCHVTAAIAQNCHLVIGLANSGSLPSKITIFLGPFRRYRPELAYSSTNTVLAAQPLQIFRNLAQVHDGIIGTVSWWCHRFNNSCSSNHLRSQDYCFAKWARSRHLCDGQASHCFRGFTFPEEAASLEESTGTSDVGRKRAHDGVGIDLDTRGGKRRNLDGTPKLPRKYEAKPYERKEGADCRLFGEEPHLANPDDRHFRMLSHFAFFDPSRDLEMVSIEINIEGAGFTAAKFDVEDQGQQRELEDYYDEDVQYVRLTTVRGFIINYLDETRPVYVETDHAFYELLDPSKKHRREYRSFYKPQRVMQLIISSAFENPDKQFADFVQYFTSLEVLGQLLVERDMWDVVPKLKRVLETIYYADRVRESDTVSRLLSRDVPKFFKMVDVTKLGRRSRPILDIEYKGNPELAVL